MQAIEQTMNAIFLTDDDDT